ncbi:hypothetical protein K438DRAFT_2067026 [Mycena galopus ATCC 62051]|nr:hypothetical protein K438DRAFT_2067026 [Mycena galopus ATCC 62051]
MTRESRVLLEHSQRKTTLKAALLYPFPSPHIMDINVVDIPDDGKNPIPQARPLKDFLVGPMTNILPAHGWTHASILYNHLDENVNKILGKPITSLAAVIITHDRPADRAMGADHIADAIVSAGLATKDDFMVIPPTPKEEDPDAPILPHTNLILCNSAILKQKFITDPSKAIIHARRPDESDGFTFYILPAYPDQEGNLEPQESTDF